MDVNFQLEQIQDTAREFLDMIGNRKVIAFHGAMGAGKTTLIHAICDFLKVKDAVSSPTFSIINEYTTGEGQQIFHLDLYRIRDLEEAISAGVEDCYYSGSLCFVEWPEKAKALLPEDTVHCTIKAVTDNTRNLRIKL